MGQRMLPLSNTAGLPILSVCTSLFSCPSLREGFVILCQFFACLSTLRQYHLQRLERTWEIVYYIILKIFFYLKVPLYREFCYEINIIQLKCIAKTNGMSLVFMSLHGMRSSRTSPRQRENRRWHIIYPNQAI